MNFKCTAKYVKNHMSLETCGELSTETLPRFLGLLSEKDKMEYFDLKTKLEMKIAKRNRGHRVEDFDSALKSIREYVEKGDSKDMIRSLVCGACWMGNMIAINTRQIRFLINKCKSSINGSLQRLGYLTNPLHAETWKMLQQKLPYLKDNYIELRQWTIRSKSVPLPQQTAVPIIPVEIINSPIRMAPINPYTSNYCINHPVTNNVFTPIYPNALVPVAVGYNTIPAVEPQITYYNNNNLNHGVIIPNTVIGSPQNKVIINNSNIHNML